MQNNKKNHNEGAIIMPEPEIQGKTQLTVGDIHNKLTERVSGYDADLILNTALLSAGVCLAKETNLSEQAMKNVCLELIKQGGPAFQVGQSFYPQNP